MNEPLSDAQIEVAQLMIGHLHSIDDTKLEVSFPWLCCCAKHLRKKDDLTAHPEKGIARQNTVKLLGETHEREKNYDSEQLKMMKLLKGKKDKIAEDKAHKARCKKDPFHALGLGLANFRRIIVMLLLMFAILTALSFPMLHNYR